MQAPENLHSGAEETVGTVENFADDGELVAGCAGGKCFCGGPSPCAYCANCGVFGVARLRELPQFYGRAR